METVEMSETEMLVKINSLKDKHELLKKEILEHLNAVEEKEKELLAIEGEYVNLIGKLAM